VLELIEELFAAPFLFLFVFVSASSNEILEKFLAA